MTSLANAWAFLLGAVVVVVVVGLARASRGSGGGHRGGERKRRTNYRDGRQTNEAHDPLPHTPPI